MAEFAFPCSSVFRPRMNLVEHALNWVDRAKRKVKLGYRPVHDFTMSKDIDYIKPKARIY